MKYILSIDQSCPMTKVSIMYKARNVLLNTKFHKIVQQYPQTVFLNPRFIDNPQVSRFCSIIAYSNSAFSSGVKTVSDEGTSFSDLTFFKGDAKGDGILS